MKFHLKKIIKLVSFDITNMYSNVPTNNLTDMIKLICNQNGINKELRCEIKFREVLIKKIVFNIKTYNIYKRMA